MRAPRSMILLVTLALALAGCGATAANGAPTQTRAAELGQIATLTAPTPTPNAAATQTRAAEVTQIATLSAPTAAPNAGATQTRAAEVAQIATLTAPTAAPPNAAPPTSTPLAAARPSATPASRPATDAVGTFLGSLDKSEALIGIVTDGQTLRAYVCDGSSVAEWFTGPLTSGTMNLTSLEGVRLRGTFNPTTQQFAGDVEFVGGTRMTFSSLQAGSQGNNGLYRATGTSNGQAFNMGVIVLPDGRFAGVFWQNDKLTPVTDPKFAPGALTAVIPGAGAITAPRLSAP